MSGNFISIGRLKNRLMIFLRASSCQLPRFYGRVKIHKDSKPLRPVISALGSATYGPSKYLAGVLAPLVGNNGFALRNNLHFIEKAREMKIQPGMVMVSFDVKALYTSLPIERTINVVRTTNWRVMTRYMSDRHCLCRTSWLCWKCV